MDKEALFEKKTEKTSLSIEKLDNGFEARASVADPTGLLPGSSFEAAARTDGKVEIKCLFDLSDVPEPEDVGLAEDEGVAEYGRLTNQARENARSERNLSKSMVDVSGRGFLPKARPANSGRGLKSMQRG